MSLETISTHWAEEGPKLLWRASVGTGFSSVAVSGGRAYTMGNTTNQDTIWCLDAKSGNEVWKLSYAARPDPQWYEGGPGSTPTVDRGRVFTISKWGDVFCLDAATGKAAWQRDLKTDGFHTNRWGFEGSALLWRELVIFNVGEAGIALDRSSGRIVWSNGTNGAGYASPTLCTLHGKAAVLIFAAKHLIAVDPDSGHELWRFPFETGWSTNITDPLCWDDRILISSFSHGSALLSISQDKPELLYDSNVLHNHLSPGIRIGEYLYAFNGEAKTDTDLRCIDLPTGQLKWTSKEPRFGSMIQAGSQLVLLSGNGELLVIDPSPKELKVVARAKVLSGTCWTPPALAGGRLYVRNAKGELRCLDVRPADRQ
jgi:outer membrane protein assembly factor BamB